MDPVSYESNSCYSSLYIAGWLGLQLMRKKSWTRDRGKLVDGLGSSFPHVRVIDRKEVLVPPVLTGGGEGGVRSRFFIQIS